MKECICQKCWATFEHEGPRAARTCPPCKQESIRRYQRLRYAQFGRKDRAVGRTIPAWGDTVEALCWCGENIVMVHASEVRACRTGSCGLPECGPEHPLVIHNRFGA